MFVGFAVGQIGAALKDPRSPYLSNHEGSRIVTVDPVRLGGSANDVIVTAKGDTVAPDHRDDEAPVPAGTDSESAA